MSKIALNGGGDARPLKTWSDFSYIQYIPAIKFEILFARISYVSFKPWNVQRLSANNFNKNQFWENQNGNFVLLYRIHIFNTVYDIPGISGGKIYLAGSTVSCSGKNHQCDWVWTCHMLGMCLVDAKFNSYVYIL